MRYLDKETREEFLFLASLQGLLQSYICKNWTKILNPKQMKKMKCAATYIFNTYMQVLNNLNNEFANVLINDMKITTLKPYPKYKNVKAELAVNTETEIALEVQKDDLDVLREAALCICIDCNRNYKNCNYRKVFLRTNTPVYDPEAKGCPYKPEIEKPNISA